MEIVILIIYASAMLFIFLYSIVQIQLVYHYLKNKKRDEKIVDPPEMEHFPFVTFQLPIYNEKYVIERLIESISVMDYPKDKFEIQVLDDSDDETSEIVSNLINEKARLGLNIQHIHTQHTYIYIYMCIFVYSNIQHIYIYIYMCIYIHHMYIMFS